MTIYEVIYQMQNFASSADDGWEERNRKRFTTTHARDEAIQRGMSVEKHCAPCRIIINILPDQREQRGDRRKPGGGE